MIKCQIDKVGFLSAIYAYLMKIAPISKIDVIRELPLWHLLPLSNFVSLRHDLVSNWQGWYFVRNVWIINEDRINFKHWCHKWVVSVAVVTSVKFHVSETWLSVKLTGWHFVSNVWIINEDRINFKNWCHKWVGTVAVVTSIKFHVYATWLSVKLTRLAFCQQCMST